MKCENKTLNDHAHCTQSPSFITHTSGPIQHVVKCINVVHLTEIPQQSFNAPEFSNKRSQTLCVTLKLTNTNHSRMSHRTCMITHINKQTS